MPRIALSYRRDDTSWIVGRIFDRLKAHYELDGRRDGDNAVFIDYDSTPLGLDFRTHIKAVLDDCDVLLVIIGPQWTGGTATHRLSTTDWVRIEIEIALNRKIPTIPVLIDRTPLPQPEELPEEIRDLAFRQAAIVDTQVDFNSNIERLIRQIDRLPGIKNPSNFRRRLRSSLAWLTTPRPTATRIIMPTLIAVLAALSAYYFAIKDKGAVEPVYEKYNSAELGVSVIYPINILSLDNTERRQRKLILRNAHGDPWITILRVALPENKDVKIGRQNEVDDLQRMGFTLTYIAPEREQNWSNWYVLSGLKHGTVFYFRRWYANDSIVSIEFVYPKDQALIFKRLIADMTREFAYNATAPKLDPR
jgi:TIR domain-containing protein